MYILFKNSETPSNYFKTLKFIQQSLTIEPKILSKEDDSNVSSVNNRTIATNFLSTNDIRNMPSETFGVQQ